MRKTVYFIATGEALEAESVDAAELVSGGEYSYEKPGDLPVSPTSKGRDEIKAELNRLRVTFDAKARTDALAKLLAETLDGLEKASKEAKNARIVEITAKGDEATDEEKAELERLMDEAK